MTRIPDLFAIENAANARQAWFFRLSSLGPNFSLTVGLPKPRNLEDEQEATRELVREGWLEQVLGTKGMLLGWKFTPKGIGFLIEHKRKGLRFGKLCEYENDLDAEPMDWPLWLAERSE